MYHLLILICYAAHEMKSKWFDRCSNTVKKYKIEKFRGWCQRLKKENVMKWKECESARTVAMSFLCLKVEGFADEMCDMTSQCLTRLHDLKWRDMQCQRVECGRQRSSCKLRKCSSCKVVRYCSRRCQKRAWNAHKWQCRKLKYLRRKRSEWIQSIRENLLCE